MPSFPPSERVPTRLQALKFAAKVLVFRFLRGLNNIRKPVPLHLPALGKGRLTVAAEVWTPLWTAESAVENQLQLGKVQNLRLAANAIDGIMVRGGQTFSFWRQIGRASRAKGYVAGRELREGCLIPAIGGGLCQLSNALYEAALQSGCEVVERHPHSRVVPGSAAAHGRDATVAWNYVDLRFRPPTDMRIEARLSSQELVVRCLYPQLPAKTKTHAEETPLRVWLDPQAHTCTDCGAQSCFRHMAVDRQDHGSVRKAFLMDECWPEFLAYAEQAAAGDTVLGLPMFYGRYGGARFLKAKVSQHYTCWPAAIARALSMRLSTTVPERLQRQLAGSERLAARLAAQLPYDVMHITLAQSFLPYLWRKGVLGGRSFAVLMTRPPLRVLHDTLDRAAEKYPERTTFSEYRAPEWMVEAEEESLASASQIITPNSAIARMFGSRAVHLPWKLPLTPVKPGGKAVVYPGPTVARKGAYELRDALRGLECAFLPLGNNLEATDFWQGVALGSSGKDWLDQAAIVVQPALLEDNPRPLLRALSAGIPVICTEECGLAGLPNVTTVQFGDVAALRAAIASRLK